MNGACISYLVVDMKQSNMRTLDCVKILNMGYMELGVFFINIHADGAAVKTLDLEAKIH